MRLDPLAASTRILHDYRSYLVSTFAPRDPDLAGQFERALANEFTLHKGPFLQASAPYETSVSLRSLADEGVLPDSILALDEEAFPVDRPLYVHQESAIRKSAAGRNLVVATGTGSGKTECFLLPILDGLLRERDAGTLNQPGVRALLLYPMNALANDQVKRLRRMLQPFPDITFGRYVGETKTAVREAEDDFRARYPHEPRVPNELIAREQMQESPPHILLTNYAMLEYLLLRPADSAFFDGPTAQHWSHVVLDEVHVYDGARGTEIAMLLRRVRDRVLNSERSRLRYFATSATLGRGVHDYPDLVRFASDLTDEAFDWDAEDPQRQDVIGPKRKQLVRHEPSWELPQEKFATLRDVMRDDAASTEDVAAIVAAHVSTPPSTTLAKGDFAAAAFADERHVVELQERCQKGSVGLTTAAKSLFQGPEATSDLVALIDVCVAARHRDDDAPLIPARYHFFVRALEGAFVCLHPEHPGDVPSVSLNRSRTCAHCRDRGLESTVFELGTCRRCSAAYVLGAPDPSTGRLVQAPPRREINGYYLLGEAVPEDEDSSDPLGAPARPGQVADKPGIEKLLCPACGRVFDSGACTCGAGVAARTVTEAVTQLDTLHKCLACSQHLSGDIVFRAVTGSDAPVSVIATSLYQELPPSVDPGQVQKVGEGRKLLTFSDSRQDAAFFAPYLERTYNRAIRRRLMYTTVAELFAREDEAPRFDDVVTPLRKRAAASLVLDPDASPATNRTKVETWVTGEIVAIDRANSLEGTGCMETFVVPPAGDPCPQPLLDLGLSSVDAIDLIQVLLDTLRNHAVVSIPDGVDENDAVFSPRNTFEGVREQGRGTGVIGWLPTRASNRRLDYLQRLFERRGIAADAREVLGGLWRYLTDTNSPWRKSFAVSQDKARGTIFRLDHTRIAFRPRTPQHQPSRCDTCSKIAWHVVDGVCPTYRCPGTAHPVEDADALDAEHYARLYTSLEPTAASVQEHTAQWTPSKASSIQDDFVNGNVNVLSCSTTFELGVDVGEVQAVLMRNMPPSPANYVQRAGRAGRRTDSAALVATFAQRRNHDLAYFDSPNRMVDGVIAPPRILLDNTAIARRHVHSVAFSMFERQSNGHHTVEDFFLADSDAESAHDEFISWLNSHPAELAAALDRFLPRDTAVELGVESWDWVEALTVEKEEEPTHGWLVRAAAEVQDDVASVRQLIDELIVERSLKQADRMQRLERTLTRRRLLDFLATSNVLPKYGFPVDVVELDVSRSGDTDSESLDLTRDLAFAISEYAPGASVVAAKALWESRGLRTIPQKAWPQYGWSVCDMCGTFRQALGAAPQGGCPNCGGTGVRAGHAGSMVVPIFGFVGRRSADRPGDQRPERLAVTETYFASYKPPEPEPEPVGGLGGSVPVERRFSRQGRITVVNRGPRGRGFRLCEVCGFGEPAPVRSTGRQKNAKSKPHRRPNGRGECKGIPKTRHLGHQYLTDVVELRLRLEPRHTDEPAALSLLHALLQSVDALTINPQDVGGAIVGSGIDSLSLVLFDSVPGGAGHARRMADNLPELFAAALRKVANCTCAADTSCYQCLRTYGNQRHHEMLSRALAEQALRAILGAGSGDAVASADTIALAHESARPLLLSAVTGGAPLPCIGYELDDLAASGWQLEAAWPDAKVAVVLDVDRDRDAWLAARDWDVRPLSEWTESDLRDALAG